MRVYMHEITENESSLWNMRVAMLEVVDSMQKQAK